jgi:hypothetical protein
MTSDCNYVVTIKSLAKIDEPTSRIQNNNEDIFGLTTVRSCPAGSYIIVANLEFPKVDIVLKA